MPQPIRLKIDVTKLDKSLFFHAQSGAIYCDLVAWENREPSQYGDTHTITQDRPKDDRDRKMPIVGNMTDSAKAPQNRSERDDTHTMPEPTGTEDDIPF